jgi:tRNA pseudouridine(38-40) synthase
VLFQNRSFLRHIDHHSKEYHGKAYCGWQRQIGQTTVQEVRSKFVKIAEKNHRYYRMWRTDWVHAINYIAHFEGNRDIMLWNRKSINSILPKDISAESYFCNGPFHPRFDAISRKYIYKSIQNKFQ